MNVCRSLVLVTSFFLFTVRSTAAEETCSASSEIPLSWRVPHAVNDDMPEFIAALIAEAEAKGPPEAIRQHRNFGQDSGYEGGHNVTYLHLVAPSSLLDHLWAIANKADVAAGWHVSAPLDFGPGKRPPLRCIEAIDYFSSKAPVTSEQKEDLNRDPSLSWHHDGDTLLTVAVLLSEPGKDFEGGSFEVRRGASGKSQTCGRTWNSGASHLDGTVWRGWDEHRVTPITTGLRRVLVAEWWTGEPASLAAFRASDTEEGYKRALKVDPKSSVLYRALAKSYSDKGKPEEEVLVLLQQALLIDPLDARTHNDLGRIQKDAEEAEISYRNAIRLIPQYAQARHNLGVLLSEKGDMAGAETELAKAIQSDPQYAKALHHLSVIVDRRGGRETEAESWLRVAIALDPTPSEAHRNLARMLALRGDDGEAAKSLGTAIRIRPNDGEAYFLLGSLLERRGMESKAEPYLQKAVKFSPGNAEAYNKLGAVLGSKGDFANAVVSFRQALALDPAHTDAKENLQTALGALADANG